MEQRTIADLLRALRPKGQVEAWVALTLGPDTARVMHRLKLNKGDTVDELKKLAPGRPARFQVREWNYEFHGYQLRARSVLLGTDEPDEIEAPLEGT